jgi:hypothetical protein
MTTNLLIAIKPLAFQKKNAKLLSRSMTVHLEKIGRITLDGKRRISLVIGAE